MADVLAAAAVIAALILVWVILYDSNRFVVRQHRVTDKRIIKPARAVVLADLHNKRYGRDNVRLLEAIRSQRPDLILVAGDMINASPGKSLRPALHLLEELAKDYPICYGNGNHEHRLSLYPQTYGNMAREYAEALGKTGISPLVNSHVDFSQYGINVYGAQIDKELYRRFRNSVMPDGYMTELLGQKQEGRYTVLLAHHPDYFAEYAGWGADLVLAGHVHGGVVRVPFWGKGVVSPSLRLFPRYDGGVFQEGNAVMIVSRGLGAHTIPIRLFNPGELWVVDFEPES